MGKPRAIVVLVICIFGVAVSSARAQDYGLFVAYSSTTADGPIVAPASSNASPGQMSVVRARREGSAIGMFIGTSSRRRLSVEVDVLWSIKGIKARALRYLETPVLARLNIATIHQREVHVVIGPAFGLRVTGEKGLIKSYDLALVAGGGVTFGNAIVQVRYERGLRNIAIGAGPLGGGVWRNRALLFCAALLI